MTVDNFARSFSNLDIAKAVRAEVYTVDYGKSRQKLSIQTRDQQVIAKYRELMRRAHANRFLKQQYFSLRTPQSIQQQFLDINSILDLVKSLLYHVYGTRVETTSSTKLN
eukprot:331642-Rhodomonas_salina.1